ncbi:MAG: excinuclease ABC subunit UvrC [Patescibacteria group bacterium]
MFKPDLANISGRPGCYLMYDKSGKVIYVGKAVDLRKRVVSYWNKTNQSVKTNKLLEKVAKVDFMVTDSETEALILENQLIKRHNPPYNVLLRDDKSYQYIRIDLKHPYPVVEIVRRPDTIKKEVKVHYFGPYTSGLTIKYIMQLINRIFPLCANAAILNKNNQQKPCLNWHLGRCLGVCAGQSSSADYHKVIDEVIDFLSGRTKDWRKYLRERMEAAAAAKKFEEALKLREQITALDAILEKQKVAQPDELVSQDIWGWLITAEQAVVAVLKVRAGKVIDQQTFVLKLPMEIDLAEFLQEAIRSVYSVTLDNWPKEILMPYLPKDVVMVESWLGDLAGHSVKIRLPKRGIKKRLVLLVQKNAALQASAKVGANLQTKTALVRLQKLLHTGKLKRIEAYDISHLGGTATVGSMVVFADGKPAKTQYRRFRIKTVRGIDDYASLGEIIYRRLRPKRLADKRFAINLPNLILIDGGKGQLGAVARQVYQTRVPEIPLISLAKREEEVFVIGRNQPIKLSLTSPELQLLQRIRDEAHRFAISYHTVLRSRELKTADKIPGIGPATRKKLIKEFGSWSAVRQASLAKLQKAVGKKAQLIKRTW